MRKTFIFWFTGFSGSGKTTVAVEVKQKLEAEGYSICILDGDEVRQRQHKHLGFTPQDIKENNSLIAKMCKENRGKYDVILVPIISPFRESRQKARDLLGSHFYEIYFNASLACVIARDVKGLYAKAKQSKMKNLIGFSPDSIYEVPDKADFIVNSESDSVENSTKALYDFILSRLNCLNKE